MQKLLLLLLLFNRLPVQSQLPSRFLMYGVKEGLSQNSVHAIFRDRDGLVWIGTQDGLNSFDGKNFRVYRHSDDDSTTISDQFVLKIKEDRAGNLWIGTRNGLNCFNKRTGKFRRYYSSVEERHNFQAAYPEFFIREDDKVIVPGPELSLIDHAAQTVTKIAAFPAAKYKCLSVSNYRAFFVDEQNRLVVSEDIRTGKSRVINNITLPGTFTQNGYMAQAANDSLLLIYTAFQADKIYPFNTKKLLLGAAINAPFPFNDMAVAGINEMYLSGTKGVALVNAAGVADVLITAKSAGNGLPPGPVLTVYKDGEENLWLGTSGTGAAVSNRRFDHFRMLRTGVNGDAVTAVSRRGRDLYMGARSGLYKVSDFSINTNSVLQKTGNFGIITALTADLQGNLWFGSAGPEITRLSETGSISRVMLPGTSAGNISILHMNTDAAGRVLIASTNGLYVLPPGSTNMLSIFNSGSDKRLQGNYVMSTFADKAGNIWVSNNLGLNVLTPQLSAKLSFPSSSDSESFIKRTIVSSVAENSRGEMWIGTIRNGLYKYANNKFSHYTVSAGLASDVVFNVLCDKYDRLWATTGAGLSVFDEKNNAFTTLTALDGVPAAGFIFGAAVRDDNLLFLGTSEGLLVCNTDEIVLPHNAINAFVADIKVNGQSVLPAADGIHIMPDDKLISIELAASPAFFSGNIIYQYRMLGQRDEWITLPQGVNTISFTGLPYKTLSMQVRAAGSVNNLDKAKMYVLTIHSRPPFWKTTAFIIAAALMFIILVMLIVREYNQRTYKKQLQQLRLEKGLQGERIRIGRDLHDNIGAYTSALIAGLNHIRPVNDIQEKHVTDLKDYGSNIMGFLRETIWMLNAEDLTVTAFADRFKNYTLRIGKNYPAIDFHFTEDILTEKSPQPSSLLNLFRIMQEALQNACKHSGASTISVHIESKSIICAQVSDNGSGFENVEGEEHYGLANMKERAMKSGFILDISTGAQGTRVQIKENTANAALPNSPQSI